ncbi:germination protein [Paenibacillus baekrokdamisoli]|uniref:Germination protein n=1 Tax=Paenibacillus baekrokdamisoli TaxID=1712516 RepID=A0A3G9ISX1_9BACL|nr:endospore germination permease [Paenibacillus baekrokdamisoli]MBB3067690.1 spore germination protein KB [Paenibacillus baekrokdamisoli]BBH19125.1 germination protein [Paenibacillus baekrokdamisoli]
MIEKGKISAFQMAIMMYPTIIATAIISLPTIMATHAGRDMWLSPIWASLMGILIVFFTYQLNKLYPKESIVEYSGHILGQIPGKILGFVYFFVYVHDNGFVIRQYGEFIVGTFLPKTPIIVVISSMILVCAFAVRGGVEVLGRCAQMFVPVMMIILLLMCILLIPDMKPNHMFPVMEKGMKPSLMGSISAQSWFVEFIDITFLLPFLTDREKGMKWGIISVFAVMLTMVVTSIVALFLFGAITGSFNYPVMVAARYISLAGFLEHMESLVMAFWVLGAFVKISMYYYVLVLITSQWLNLSDYRPIVFPLGFLLVPISIWVAPNLQEMSHFIRTSDFFYLISIKAVIPMLLLIIVFVQQKFKKKS